MGIAQELGYMSCYLAGPMSHFPEFNFPMFAQATADLRGMGFKVCSPAEHDIAMGFDPKGYTGEEPLSTLANFTPKEAMKWDLATIMEVDCVVVLPGWEASNGAGIETRLAWFLGKDVLSYPDLTIVPPTQSRRQTETRVVSATGGAKGKKPETLGAIDPLALQFLAKVAAMGEQKYARFNFLKGYDWSLSVDALFRHLLAFLNGEDYDPESGLPHTAHVAWHGLCLTSFLERGLGTDDRYVQPTEGSVIKRGYNTHAIH